MLSRPQLRQRIKRLGLPRAFQRIPPRSQIERASPQGQRASQERDWASMSRAQAAGSNQVKKRWMKVMRCRLAELCQTTTQGYHYGGRSIDGTRLGTPLRADYLLESA